MKLNRIIATLVAVLMLTTSAYGQFDFGGDAPALPDPPWVSFHMSTKVRVKLDFRNATLDAVIHVFSQASGVTIIKDPAFVGGITLQSPKAQSLNDAFAMLNAVLNLKSFDITQQGSFLVIKARAPQAQGGRRGGQGGGTPGTPGGWGGQGGQGGGRSQTQLKVYTIKYANATQLARVINEVFAPAANAQGGGRGGFGGGGGGFGGFGGGAQGGAQGQGGGGGGAATPAVKASADDFSNSVVVNAPSSQQDQVAALILQIDKQTDLPQQSRVFKLKYAAAADLVPVVQNIFASNTPLGRGGSTTQSTQNNNPFRGGGGGFFGRFGQNGGNNQTAGGSVVADTRTNSLVISATGTNLDLASHVIEDLDKPVAYESSTFIYALKNARADVVANLLNQSFGNRTTGTAATGGAISSSGLSQNTTGTNRAGATGGNQPLSLGQTNTTGQNGTRTNNQTAGYNAGGAARPQAQAGTAAVNGSGLNADGQIVNVRDLTGQVVLVPDIDTNSVVVVTAPQYKEIVQGILAQLDQIPQQVMIETLVVEANLDATNQLGIEWNFNQGKPFGISGGTATGTSNFGLQQNTSQPQGLRYTLNAGQYGAFLEAVHADTRFDVLSTPRIFTTNNATAQINISQSLPYVTNQTVDTNGTTLFNYNFLDVGIVLTVTPRITSNGYVTMDVSQTANDFVGYTSFNAPIVNQREAQTTVSVKDGETIVLGGIINNSVSKTVNKVPVLGDIPIIGNLFRSTKSEKNKTELLVFLTPRVVRDPSEAQKLREETQLELEPKTQEKIPKFNVKVIQDMSKAPVVAAPAPGITAPAAIMPSAIAPVKP